MREAVLQNIRTMVSLVLETEKLLEVADSIPETQRNVAGFDAQIVKLKEDISRNRDFEMKLYENLQNGMISQDEYFLFKKNYEEKIRAAQQAVKAVESDRRQAVEQTRESQSWMEVFKKYRNITEIDRKVVVELLDEIVVFKDKRIEVHFRYGDEYEKTVRYLNGCADRKE